MFANPTVDFFADLHPDDLRNVVYQQGQEIEALKRRFLELAELGEITPTLGVVNLDIKKPDSDVVRLALRADDMYDDFGIHAVFASFDDTQTPTAYLNSDTGIWTMNGAVIGMGSGSSAGGWFINSTTIFNDQISLDSSKPAIKLGSATDYVTGAGIFMGKNSGTYKMHVGDPAGHYLAWNGSGLSTSGQWITGSGLNPSLQSWETNIAFSSASASQVNWSSGTIRLNDGTTYSISSGNTGTMSALTYIYLDTGVSTTVLQTTTTYSTAVGSGKILVATALNNTTAASVMPIGGQQPIIDGGGQIAALSIVAGNLAAGSVTASKISVANLAAVSANMGALTVDSTIKMGSATDYLTGTGMFMGLSSAAYKFHIGNPSGNYLAWNASALSVSGQWISGAGLNPSLQTWTTNIVFSSASATQVNWTTGTIRLNDATTYSISPAGNTGTMAALTYIYLDTAVSTTALQVTTTYSTAVGSGKILIAVAQNNTTAASVIPMGGQQPVIDGGAQIAALSILAANIAAGAVTASKISVTDLSAVNTNTGSLTVSGTLSMPGSSAAIAMGSTPPTSATSGTGGWIDRNVWSAVKNSKQTFAVSMTDGSVKIGSDLSAAATTGFVFAGSAITYNSESLAAGALLIGDNTASKANILWDVTAHQLKFRGGTTTQAYIDTDGSIAVAGGNIKLNLLGVKTIMDGILYEDNYVSGGVGPLYIRQMIKTYGESIANIQVASQPTIPNSNFETTLLSTNWTTTDGTPLKSSTQAHGGTYSLELNTSDGVESAAYITITELAAFLELWLYGSGEAYVAIQCYDASSVYLGDANFNVANINNGDATWKRYIVGGGVPSGTTKYKIKLLCNSGTVYIDDLVGYHGNGYQESVGGDGGVAFSGSGDFSANGVLLPRSILGWTPAISFTTPGNLNVVYSTQKASWHQVSNKLYCLTFRIVTSTFTHTTASGSFRITGIPATAGNADANLFEGGAVSVRGYTKANFTQVYGYVVPGTTRIQLWASGSGQAATQLTTADFPTGGTIDIAGTIFYSTD